MKARLTILQSKEKQIRDWIMSHPGGHERGCIVLFRRIAHQVEGLPSSDRFIALEVINMDGDWVLESSQTHFVINMRKLPEVYLRCEQEKLELGFVHNHPAGMDKFSRMDDQNERNILHGISGCNGKSSFLVSMVFVDEKWIARIRQGVSPETIIEVRHIAVFGQSIALHGVPVSEAASPESLMRQEAAFGKPFNMKMASLRVAVIGLGGTGSPTATLLARSGIGELIIVDGDILEKSNMNRVRGYTGEDVGKNKALKLGEYIVSMRLGTKVSVFMDYLHESPSALDAVSTADVVFGCTDDVQGRDILNQALYYYAQVLIDLGIAARIDTDKEGVPYLLDQRGRVSLVMPESGACLRCQRVVTEELLSAERAFNENPELKELDPETLEREYYLRGGGVSAPGIGPFTSATADNAVATLMDLVKPFRVLPSDLRADNVWIDFKHLSIHSNEPIDDPSCIHCRTQMLLLKREDSYRLDTPRLGRIA
jgi:molybdopterin/thiamine biosynthesis adenylyltransferase